MHISTLLDLDILDINVIQKCFKNRDTLKKGIEISDLSIFNKISSIEDPHIFDINDSDFNKLFCVSKDNLIPLLSGDEILVNLYSGESIYLSSIVFFQNMLDGLSDLDNLVSSNKNLFFKLPNIKKISLLKWNEVDEKLFYQKIVDMNQLLVGQKVKNKLEEMMCYYFGSEIFKNSLSTKTAISILNENSFEMNFSKERDDRFHMFLIKNISEYNLNRDLFKLIEVIKVLSRK